MNAQGARPERRRAGAWPAALIAGMLGGFGGHTASEEGMLNRVHADPVWGWKVPTACGGQTGEHIKPGMEFSVEECLKMIDERHVRTWEVLRRHIHGEITLGGALALTSLADNVGVSAVRNSTMVRLINQGVPEIIWCRQFTEAYARYTPIGLPIGDGENAIVAPIGWMVAGGRSCRESRNCRGIVGRREREQVMCMRDVMYLPSIEEPSA